MMSTLFIFRISYASSRRCFVAILVLALLICALFWSSSSLYAKLVADSFFYFTGALILSELAILIFPIVLCIANFGYYASLDTRLFPRALESKFMRVGLRLMMVL